MEVGPLVYRWLEDQVTFFSPFLPLQTMSLSFVRLYAIFSSHIHLEDRYLTVLALYFNASYLLVLRSSNRCLIFSTIIACYDLLSLHSVYSSLYFNEQPMAIGLSDVKICRLCLRYCCIVLNLGTYSQVLHIDRRGARQLQRQTIHLPCESVPFTGRHINLSPVGYPTRSLLIIHANNVASRCDWVRLRDNITFVRNWTPHCHVLQLRKLSEVHEIVLQGINCGEG